MLLAGDIGGTKTRLGVFEAGGDPRRPVCTATFPSADFDSVESLCRAFLEDAGAEVTRASLGVPGPVMGGRAVTTNLPWEVEEARLAEALGLEAARLFNDLAAVARAVPELEGDELRTIVPGEADPDGPVAVVAPGTGLGVAYGVRSHGRFRVIASEAGHTDFGPVTRRQADLLRYLGARLDRVSYERVCSGRGLPNLYEFLKASGSCAEPEWLAERLAAAEDPTPVIVEAALEEGTDCALCRETLALFVSILGAKAGNEALAVVATGGVFLAGGIPPRIVPLLEDGRFAAAFRAKGRMRTFLERVPVHVVTAPETALLGAVLLGRESEEEEEEKAT
ncbi:MAG: glucokinase [Gemmatimonadota bacterium]|nr:glucokinase [Gemmatimonadota bacterium]